MSRYADKRTSRVPCAIAACSEIGTELRVFNGRPDWFCPDHAARVVSR